MTETFDASRVCYYIDETEIVCKSADELVADGETYNVFTRNTPFIGRWIKIIAFDASTKAQDPSILFFNLILIKEFFSDVPPKFTVASIEKPEEHITVSCIDGDIEDLTATGEPDDPFCKNSLDTSKLVRKYFNFIFSYKSK